MDKGGAKTERGYPGPTRGYEPANRTVHLARDKDAVKQARSTCGLVNKLLRGARPRAASSMPQHSARAEKPRFKKFLGF